jgi:hypothetical protein
VRVTRESAELAAMVSGGFAGAAWIVAPMDGAAEAAANRVAGIAGPVRVERWSEHRDRIGVANLVRVRAALDRRAAKAG